MPADFPVFLMRSREAVLEAVAREKALIARLEGEKLDSVAAALERCLEVRFVSPRTHRVAQGGSWSAAR